MIKFHFFNFLLFSTLLFNLLSSCSHTPYSDFLEIKIGSDREDVLNQLGSPLRTKRLQDKDIWTYRFFENHTYLYKEIIFEKQKVFAIEDARHIQIEEIERKEKLIEEDLKDKNPPRILQKKALKKSSNSDFLEKSSQKPVKFDPVE